jgi:hypothetical protein
MWLTVTLTPAVEPIFSSERMLYKGYYRKSSVGKNLWSWVSRGLAPGRTDWRLPATPKVTLSLCYNYYVKIGYQETSSEDKRFLCELWLQWYMECVVQGLCYSWLWWRSISGQWIRYPIRNPVERHRNMWQYLKHLCVWETVKEIFLIH